MRSFTWRSGPRLTSAVPPGRTTPHRTMAVHLRPFSRVPPPGRTTPDRTVAPTLDYSQASLRDEPFRNELDHFQQSCSRTALACASRDLKVAATVLLNPHWCGVTVAALQKPLSPSLSPSDGERGAFAGARVTVEPEVLQHTGRVWHVAANPNARPRGLHPSPRPGRRVLPRGPRAGW